MELFPILAKALLIASAPLLFLSGWQTFDGTSALGQAPASMYKLEYEPPVANTVTEKGRSVTKITVKFAVVNQRGEQEEKLDTAEYKIHIFERGKKVAEEDVPKVTVARQLSTVLAVDVSGSMVKENRMEKTREACNVFLQNLSAKAEAGLILFDHEIVKDLPLSVDRGPLMAEISDAQPRGGTAYFDACIHAVQMLSGVKDREKIIVVMTDGIDLNSSATLQDVITEAKANKIKIYPVGIGEPGGTIHVTSVMVLDKSGSMLLPASEGENVTRLDALKVAARRFVNIIPDSKLVRSSIIEFSDGVTMPGHFTNDKQELFDIIDNLEAKGETALFDATYDGIVFLEAENPPDRKALVVMTDGIDNKSRRRVEEVIQRAKDADIRLYMLGLGKKGEIDEQTMKRMAKETGGTYHKADDSKQLIQIFEHLATEIHDDGIDVKTLSYLADQTGGKYYPARDVANLKLVLAEVSKAIQRKEYVVTFDSTVQRDDGLAHDVEIKLARRDGSIAGTNDFQYVEQVVTGYQRRGLILAQMSPIVYLGFLALFALLIAVPMGLNRVRKSSATG